MDYSSRLQRLRHALTQQNCEALIVESPIDLLYLTGLELSAGKLLVSSNEAHLFVDGRYFEACQKKSPMPVRPLENYKLSAWIQEQKISSLGFDSQFTSYKLFSQYKEATQGLSISLIPLEAPLMLLRMVKDESEITLLKEAAKLGYAGYEFVVSLLKEGISEAEAAFELEFFWKKKGAKKLAFDSIIAFGANGSMPHYRAGSTVLQSPASVLIDIGVNWKHYHSDMTRVVFIGEPDPRIQKIYAIVEEAKKRAIALCRPGTRIGDLDKVARNYIADQGYGEYFTHSLGHGLGLEVHEPPILRSQGAWCDKVLEKGMAITIEPGIYLPGIGGVRLEDTLLITEEGNENLTHA